MAKHQRRYRRHHRRHNPLGISAGVVKDAAFNAAGALGALFLAQQFNQTGWSGVAVTGAAAVAASFVGKFIGGSASEELLKGGLVATIISAVHQAGFAKNLGLGMYAPSWFATPTASSQYLQASPGNIPYRRGGGTILVPTSQGMIPVAAPAGVSGLGFHRFRSRYAGNY